MAITTTETFEKMMESLKKTIFQVVHEHKYKGGAFRDQIDNSTEPSTAMEIFLASNLVSDDTKTKIRKCYDEIKWFREVDLASMDHMEFAIRSISIVDICGVFAEDISNEEVDAQLVMVQRVDPETGEVSSAYGTLTEYEGGTMLEIAGAPATFYTENGGEEASSNVAATVVSDRPAVPIEEQTTEEDPGRITENNLQQVLAGLVGPIQERFAENRAKKVEAELAAKATAERELADRAKAAALRMAKEEAKQEKAEQDKAKAEADKVAKEKAKVEKAERDKAKKAARAEGNKRKKAARKEAAERRRNFVGVVREEVEEGDLSGEEEAAEAADA